MRPRGHFLVAVAAPVVVALTATLSGCVGLPVTVSCASWVGYETPQDMYDDSFLVIKGVVGPESGVLELETGDGVLHDVAVEAVHRVEVEGDTVQVASPRDYCTENPPQPADPLVEGERVLLFLRWAGNVPGSGIDTDLGGPYSTLTPFQGVLPFPEGSELPFVAD